MTNNQNFSITEYYQKCYSDDAEKKILESKNPVFAFLYAKHFSKSNKEELFKIVLASNNNYLIKSFYYSINFDKSKFENYLLFI